MMKSTILMNLLLTSMLTILYLLMSNILHPIFMIILLMSYSIIICLMISMWTYNYMYSIMLFLIMVSGLLIIFLYFSSLISNDQNKISLNPIMLLSFSLNMVIMITFMAIYNKNTYSHYYSMETNMLMSSNDSLFQNILKIYSYPYNNFTFLCMLYLLISLFTIIKICSIKSFSLRKIT